MRTSRDSVHPRLRRSGKARRRRSTADPFRGSSERSSPRSGDGHLGLAGKAKLAYRPGSAKLPPVRIGHWGARKKNGLDLDDCRAGPADGRRRSSCRPGLAPARTALGGRDQRRPGGRPVAGVPDHAGSLRSSLSRRRLYAEPKELRSARSTRLANTPPDGRDSAKPCSAPIDLQAVKRRESPSPCRTLERVIEERARGNQTRPPLFAWR